MKDFYRYLISKLKNYKPHEQLLQNYAYNKFPINIEGVKGSFASFILSELNSIVKASFLIIVPYPKEAQRLVLNLRKIGVNALYFPSFEKVPYSLTKPSLKILGERQLCYNALLNNSNQIIVTSFSTFIQPVVSPNYLKKSIIELKVKGVFDSALVCDKLIDMGYNRVPRVTVAGEFALRGEVLDVFIPGTDKACRVFIDWDKIDKIRYFDVISQESFESTDKVSIFPISEIDWQLDNINKIEDYLKSKVYFRDKAAFLVNQLKEFKSCDNEDILYPLSFDKKYFLTDFLTDRDKIIVINPERFPSIAEGVNKEYRELYARARSLNLVVPMAEEIIENYNNLLKDESKIIFLNYIKNTASKNRVIFDVSESHAFFGNINYLKEEIKGKIESGYNIVIFAGDDAQAQRISFILKSFDIKIYSKDISEGFIIPELKLFVLSDHEIFGRKQRNVSVERHVETKTIDSFIELEEGDYVVHINHGIGLYQGIERSSASGYERDYIKILYKDDDIIFVPTEQVNLIQRYLGGEGKNPTLDSLGGKSWSTRKNNASSSAEDLADMLLNIYADREKTSGFAYSADSEWQYEFEAKFPYEETQDQLRAIMDVKADMESAKPMDRLICGDAGNGKTEVAMRAVFKAVIDAKQVAFVSPTTILTLQHYDNFIKRFEGFPVRIEMLSRFVKPAKVKTILKDLEQGKIDVIIGTHRLLQKDVKFQDLGLLVIDEEQRFGVKDKERLKGLKVNIDSLSMSATPIPRTLHMALLKIRDVSLVSTSPYNRKPIEPIIKKFDPLTVRTAILQEVERGGQVFYLHNRIESLDSVKRIIEEIVPEVLIETAHGRMGSDVLDDKMHRFVQNQFHVLISTTIIESGIDIPNVNTIIIDRADMYGVSQLYQLKGRVGRSDRKSYAYLLYPDDALLSELAMKRLQVISDFTELGSGFQIALKDMEIRGAGNLLGRQQHGEISAIGYEMYMKLLEEAIAKKSNVEIEPELYIELDYSGFIPDSYIAQKSEKMFIYKSIAKVKTDAELETIMASVTDKYGPIPGEVYSLFSIANIKIIARKLFISSIKESKGIAKIEFGKVHILDVSKVIRLITENRGVVTYEQNRPNQIKIKTEFLNLEEKSAFICNVLKGLL